MPTFLLTNRETDTFNDKQNKCNTIITSHSYFWIFLILFFMHKSQSEKPATGGGRETTAMKPDNN